MEVDFRLYDFTTDEERKRGHEKSCALAGFFVSAAFYILVIAALLIAATAVLGSPPPDPPPIAADPPDPPRLVYVCDPPTRLAPASPTRYIRWNGADPPGWHRHKSGAEILTRRTHYDAWGRMVGTDEDHTFPDGSMERRLYTGPLPPTIVPPNYPLIVRPSATATVGLNCPT